MTPRCLLGNAVLIKHIRASRVRIFFQLAQPGSELAGQM